MEYQNKFENMLSNINIELTSIRDRFTEMESELLVARRVNDNLVKQNRILKGKCAANEQYSRREISGIPDSILNNNLEETILKIFNETGVSVNLRDVEAWHRLNQPTNPKKIIAKLSKKFLKKDVSKVMNNKKKSKSTKPQNIGLPPGWKILHKCKFM